MQIGEINNELQSISKIQEYNKQRDKSKVGQAEEKENIVTEELKDTSNSTTLMEENAASGEKKFYRDNEFKFSIHEETKQVLIKVIDRKTKEIVKEIPEEKILDMVAQMCEYAGLYIDEKK